jgi:hypothetical protein
LQSATAATLLLTERHPRVALSPRQTGFLPFEDSGLLDVQFGPEGISFDVTLENATADDRETFFVVKNVDVSISGFDYQIKQNQKWFATWLAKPALRKFLLHNITKTLELQITEMLKSADLQVRSSASAGGDFGGADGCFATAFRHPTASHRSDQCPSNSIQLPQGHLFHISLPDHAVGCSHRQD